MKPISILGIYLVLFFCSPLSAAPDSWLSPWGTQRASFAIADLLVKLERTKTGQELVAKARQFAQQRYQLPLDQFIAPGPHSATDITYLRRFSPLNPNAVQYEERVKVTLDEDLNPTQALLDLAHELVHFVHRKRQNPYLIWPSLSDYVRETVLGSGGEAQALALECQIKFEYLGPWPAQDPCGQLQRFGAEKTFFRMGAQRETFALELKKEGLSSSLFPELSPETAIFESSVTGLTYPLSALYEHRRLSTLLDLQEKRRQTHLKSRRSFIDAAQGPM